jgi:hypothetical protein
MVKPTTVTSQILKALRRACDTDLDELASKLPALTWTQVFVEVDRLRRNGQVRVTAKTAGSYLIRLIRLVPGR